MPQRAPTSSSLMRPFVVLALPGMYLLYKYNQYRQQQMETARRRVTERELMHLNTKIDKLLNKLEENEPELATSPEEECVICVNAKATMQTSPCGHRVVCRRCFVKTIQMAVSQRLLPLRCVICRAKILRLRQAPQLVTSKSWQVSSSSGSGKPSWGVPGSVSSYSVGARSVPASASLYSVTSGESSLSGVSSVSSNSGGNVSNACSTKLCGGAKCGGACLGAVPRATTSAPSRPRQPASHALRRSQHHSMKARLQEYQVHSYTGGPATTAGEPSGRLPPIREFQREFREGRRESAAAASASTRIRCAQKIVTQLETSPQKNKPHFFRPLKPSNKDDSPKSGDQSKETERKKENPKAKSKKEDKKKKDDDTKQEEKNKKDESSDNKKNENAERKKEEKLRLKAEKEAKKEAKLLAKEEERQAKLLAKEEERQAKLLAKEEKKKAKKEAKLAAQAEKEKEKNK
ncbi:uncharacterized protein LOC113231308 [Hyposmocoma kahamanoa]|uniref:uncharacterized protein LOC113231308 n=1 Tax=Hyposmocoma kahamanoa TaxID=1477025 RepID=UPI000E6D96C4|nr:uncharacterized protein LOC113231308 [Hyposmocoma kahamanoa]